jgi:tRNA modification GTPase
MNSATIAAIATPFGSGGIGIIRVSGEESLRIAKRLFRKGRLDSKKEYPSKPIEFQSHHVYHGHIIDPETQKPIDEVLVVAMQAPKSYTREDVVEIHSHSGFVVLSRIFDKVLQAGARIAEPGEFTKRAFLNGRIDLTQAEAVTDIINAKTTTSLGIATEQLAGRLNEEIQHIRNVLQSILVEMETAIEFFEEASGDVSENIEKQSIVGRLKKEVVTKLGELIDGYQKDHLFRDGIKMSVIGRPNVGKSSLMNRLIERDRAIVTAIPGTTRDIIEETININGLPVIITDTAGLHDAQEEIEKIGVEKANQAIAVADMILFVIDLADRIREEDRDVFEKIKHKKHVIVANKIDMVDSGEDLDIPETWQDSPAVKISALKGINIEELKAIILQVAVGKRGIDREIGIVPNLRHKLILEESLAAAEKALNEISRETPMELIAIDIKTSLERLGSIIGDTHEKDLLDQIFSRFCIGK